MKESAKAQRVKIIKIKIKVKQEVRSMGIVPIHTIEEVLSSLCGKLKSFSFNTGNEIWSSD